MITLTDSASIHFKKLLQDKVGVLGLRLGVKTAGCSGLSYTLDFATDIQEGDQQFESKGITVVVDASSFTVLEGTEIDWVQQGLNQYLKFNNPNVKGECGCGESFSTG